MDLSTMINTGIAGGAGVVSVLALVVAYLARRDARRSADAAEDSARQARRSADADEQAVALAAREADERAAARHDADGPTFLVRDGHLGQHEANVALTVDGGPGRVIVSARIVDVPWSIGFARGDGTYSDDMAFGERGPGEIVQSKVGLRHDRDPMPIDVVLPISITAVSKEQPPRIWTRLVDVPLQPGARVHRAQIRR